ncbi:MAG: Helix-turn-helix domain [Firmicutes bacterium]|nr:Helix-turn-helix domain [Bacillota bacterium]
MKQIFTMKDANGQERKFIADEKGQLIPYIKPESEHKTPWGASNNVNNTCKFLGLSRGTVMKLIALGQLKAIKAGKRWIVPGWAIEQFLQQPKQGA